MARITILDAVVQVLKSDHPALSPKEIHAEIVRQGLYTFGAQDPVGMIRATLRKHLRTHGGVGQLPARVKLADGDRYSTA